MNNQISEIYTEDMRNEDFENSISDPDWLEDHGWDGVIKYRKPERERRENEIMRYHCRFCLADWHADSHCIRCGEDLIPYFCKAEEQ